jgi:hypothetical protein
MLSCCERYLFSAPGTRRRWVLSRLAVHHAHFTPASLLSASVSKAGRPYKHHQLAAALHRYAQSGFRVEFTLHLGSARSDPA